MANIKNIILQCVLYCFGPFFCYPWKPFINLQFGTSYLLGFKHFWEQHRDYYNLAWHFVCLFYQLFCNFALLAAIDDYIILKYNLSTDIRWFSIISGGLWMLTLLTTSEYPIIIRISSISGIYSALYLAKSITAQSVELISYRAFGLILFISFFKNGLIFRRDSLKFAIGLAVKSILYYYINENHIGCLRDYSTLLNTGYFTLIIICSLIRDPIQSIKCNNII